MNMETLLLVAIGLGAVSLLIWKMVKEFSGEACSSCCGSCKMQDKCGNGE